MRMTFDKNRFWQLLEPEYLRAMMFCRKLIGDRDKSDDLFQDALLIACTRIRDLRDEAAFRPWLYRIIISTFRSTVRRPWWRRRVTLTPEIEDTLSTPDSADSVTARRWLERAFHAVSSEDQTLVTLHELEGWPVAELAALYGKSESAIKVQLFRARRKMKTALLRQSRARAEIMNQKLVTEAGS
jgi:RNA polymerase sigma-70 factor (ECF subfamily)